MNYLDDYLFAAAMKSVLIDKYKFSWMSVGISISP